jgi:phospholipase A1
MTDVLVFVPGGLGSDLWDGDEQIWPPTDIVWALSGYDEKRFKRLLKADLTPKRIVEQVLVVSVYSGWIKVFEGLRKNNRPLFSRADKTLRTVPYDWRKSVALAAGRLEREVTDILASKPNAAIHIVAHSLGGLVARHYLQSAPPSPAIKSLITLGAPHEGAPIALAAALGAHAVRPFTKAQTQRLAEAPGFSALYEIFPDPKRQRVFWRRDRMAPANVFDRAVASELGLNAEHLCAAEKLHDILKKPLNGVRVLQLVGSQFNTITHFVWDGGKDVEVFESKDAGDGTVPVSSVMDNEQIRFTGREHGKLMLASEAQDALGAFFDAQVDRFAITGAGAPEIEISVRDLSVTQDEPIEVVIAATNGTLASGALSFERGEGPSDAGMQFLKTPPRFSIEAPGAAQRVSLQLENDLSPGVYRPVYLLHGVDTPAYGPEFFVMEREAP